MANKSNISKLMIYGRVVRQNSRKKCKMVLSASLFNST